MKMKSGLYIETTCKNLREYNAQMKKAGRTDHYEFIGYYTSANGYKQRFYQLTDDNDVTYGEPVNIYFNIW